MYDVTNLSDIYGFARLYATLLAKGELSQQRLFDIMYDWYKANIDEFNDQDGEQLCAVSKEQFWDQISHSEPHPYKTDIQLIKAIRLVMWNISLADEYTEALDTINALNTVHIRDFEDRTGYKYSDSATAFASCEDSLNPVEEPVSDFDYMGVVRKHNNGQKLVYICAPLRGDVLQNIQNASDNARKVFESGDNRTECEQRRSHRSSWFYRQLNWTASSFRGVPRRDTC